MAQTQREHNEPQGEPVNADQAAWLETGKALGFRIEANQLWGGANGVLYPVPALPGFAALPTGARRVALYSVAKMVDYRLGQTATGNVAEKVSSFVTNSADYEPDRSCDSFESYYVGVVRDAVLDHLHNQLRADNPDAPRPKTTDKIGDKRVQKIIDDTAEKFRSERFDNVIRAGIAAGQNRADTKTGAVKPGRSRGESAAADVAF